MDRGKSLESYGHSRRGVRLDLAEAVQAAVGADVDAEAFDLGAARGEEAPELARIGGMGS